jgi:hypothetical protein
VEGSCESGNGPLGFIKCWEFLNGCTTGGPPSCAELHTVSHTIL